MDHVTTMPGALRRAPFALLAWVLSAHLPADLLGPGCRPLVLRALLDVGEAARVASVLKGASHERVTLDGLELRASAAVLALGEDDGALSDEALPAPTVDIDRRTVARVLFAFMEEARRRTGTDIDRWIGAVLDVGLLDLLAVRASSLTVPERPARRPQKQK